MRGGTHGDSLALAMFQRTFHPFLHFSFGFPTIIVDIHRHTDEDSAASFCT